MKTYKIQVFRISDNEQLYGLYANDENKEARLKEAMKHHKPPRTKLVNEDITKELSDFKNKKNSQKETIKNKKATFEEKQNAIIAYLGLDT